jgi:hypothetical protein
MPAPIHRVPFGCRIFCSCNIVMASQTQKNGVAPYDKEKKVSVSYRQTGRLLDLGNATRTRLPARHPLPVRVHRHARDGFVVPEKETLARFLLLRRVLVQHDPETSGVVHDFARGEVKQVGRSVLATRVPVRVLQLQGRFGCASATPHKHRVEPRRGGNRRAAFRV